MLPKPSKSMMIIAVGIIAVILIGVVAPMTSLDGWNTSGEIGAIRDFEGRVTLSKTNYVSSWKTNGGSEDIVATIDVRKVVVASLHLIDKYRYVATDTTGRVIKTHPINADEWITPPPVHFPTKNEWYHLETWIFQIPAQTTGQLTISLFVETHWDWGADSTTGDGSMGWDGANIKSGEGELRITSGEGAYEEGEDVSVFVKTGWADSWHLKLYPPSTRPGLFSAYEIKQFDNDIQETIKIRIQPGWFKEGDKDNNIFKLVLNTGLFEYAHIELFTIDDHERAPGTPVLTFTTNDDILHIRATAESTYRPIEEIVVWAWYGGSTMPALSDTESWILYDASYTPENSGHNYTIDFDVNAKVNKDGPVVIRVIAFDEDGRSSDHAFLRAIVKDGEFDEVDYGRDTDGFQWTITTILIILLTLFLLYIVAIKIPGIPYDKRFILIVIIGSIGLVLTYLAGTGWF